MNDYCPDFVERMKNVNKYGKTNVSFGLWHIWWDIASESAQTWNDREQKMKQKTSRNCPYKWLIVNVNVNVNITKCSVKAAVTSWMTHGIQSGRFVAGWRSECLSFMSRLELHLESVNFFSWIILSAPLLRCLFALLFVINFSKIHHVKRDKNIFYAFSHSVLLYFQL